MSGGLCGALFDALSAHAYAPLPPRWSHSDPFLALASVCALGFVVVHSTRNFPSFGTIRRAGLFEQPEIKAAVASTPVREPGLCMQQASYKEWFLTHCRSGPNKPTVLEFNDGDSSNVWHHFVGAAT